MKPQNTQNRQKKNLELDSSASSACSAVLQYFDQISKAPDAIPRLRRFILDLAVRGKLAEQDPDDEPAWELVKRIEKEKDWLTKDGQLLKSKFKKLENYDNLPHETPSKWKWCYLSELSLRIHYGYTASANQNINDIRLLRITDIQNNVVHWDSVPGCDITKNHVDQYLLSDGDILIARTGGTIGKSFLVKAIPVKAVFASYLIRVQKSQEYLDCYLKLFLESSTYWDQLESGSRGTGQPNVNGQTLGNMKVPLPPLAEQHRIVTKVDELMKLCDGLEAAQQKREKRRDRLIIASLNKLTDETENKSILKFSVSSACSAVSRPEHVHQLRQTILNLAVRGKLVPQDPNDEPATELLKRIEAEKSQIISAGDLRNQKSQPLNRDQIPFDIPPNWVWAQLSQIGIINPRNDVDDFVEASFVPMPLIFTDYKKLNQHEIRLWREIKTGFTHFAEGDVGLAKITPCFENGKSTVFRKLTGQIGAGTTELHIVRPIFVLANYILIFLKSPHFIETGISKMTGTAGQKRVPKDYFAFSLFPLPPLAEQHRILARVDELMVLCDELEAQLKKTATTRCQLLKTTIHDALSNR